MKLTDGAITLRKWREDDVAELAKAANDDEIARWMPAIPHPYSRADARSYIGQAQKREGRFAIVDARTGRLLGGIAVSDKNWGRAEVGYWIRRDARGNGYATRALTLASRWGFEKGYRRLQLHADVENVASQRVAERAGYKREGVLREWIRFRGEDRDHVMFSLLRSDL